MRTPPPDAPADEVGPELDAEHDALFPVAHSTRERHEAAGEDPIASLFDDEPHSDLRTMRSLSQVRRLSEELKDRGYRICLTNGSFDLLHIGHSMYLQRARTFGDFLIVGVDSDAKIRERKGEGRPLVPEDERLKMLTYQRAVGAVFLKSPEHKRWTLIDHVRPDVLVVTEDAYAPETVDRIRSKFKCHVEVLRRMATVSTTGRLRKAQMGGPKAAEDQPLPFAVEPGAGRLDDES